MSSAGVPSIRNREEMYFILKFREREINRQAEKEGEVNIKEFISLLAVLKTLISQEENVCCT